MLLVGEVQDTVCSIPEMAWAEPEYSPSEVDFAGSILIDDAAVQEQWDEAWEVVNNWRSAHNFPLNTFQVTLRANARGVDPRSLVAQRTKRLTSIDAKLRRFKWLKLSEMQDIGGCRAVVSSVRRVQELVKLYTGSRNLRHLLVDRDDYIESPKGSGYRSVHLVYRYLSDRSKTYNGLKIEMQFRSALQHAWATAVETVDTFHGREAHGLKAGRGEQDWRRFFALMSSAIAQRERTTLVPNTPAERAVLIDELRNCVEKLDVERRLRAYVSGLQTTADPNAVRGARYFIMELDARTKRVRITGYDNAQRASEGRAEVEREIKDNPDADAVLVSVDSIRSLRRAYPNYFLDTRLFIKVMNEEIGRNNRRRRVLAAVGAALSASGSVDVAPTS